MATTDSQVCHCCKGSGFAYLFPTEEIDLKECPECGGDGYSDPSLDLINNPDDYTLVGNKIIKKSKPMED